MEATFDRCFFHNRTGRTGWGDKNWLFGGKNAAGIRLSITNSVIVMDKIDDMPEVQAHCDYNVVVADRPYPKIQGPHGHHVASIDELKLRKPSGSPYWDVRPMPESPLVGAGADGKTIGPFDPDDELLPRSPLKEQWTDSIPDVWKVAA